MSDTVIIGILLVLFAFMSYGYALIKEAIRLKYDKPRNDSLDYLNVVPQWTSKTIYTPGEEKNESVFQKECVDKG